MVALLLLLLFQYSLSTFTPTSITIMSSQQQQQSLLQPTTMPEFSMPMFGRANASVPNQSDWGEVDNFDVELLAEYLLEDSSGVPGVTFDFK